MASSGEIVLSYNDSLLRESDVKLLQPGKWLNDAIIGFAFEYFSEEKFLAAAKDVAFVSPEVTQLIKLCSDDDATSLLASLELSEKRLVLFAVNDNDSIEHAGGSHWSLLSWQNAGNPGESLWNHYDSWSGGNSASAKYLAKRLRNVLKGTFREAENCPQQRNGSDCGVYTICFAEFLAERNGQHLQDVVTQDKVEQKRHDLINLIETLREK